MAALVVVLYHVPKWNPILNVGFINNGYLMVELFFVLSGVVIYTAYSDKLNTSTDIVRFQLLRLGRLYPVHLLYLSAFLVIEIAKLVAVSRLGVKDIRAIPFGEGGNSARALAEQVLLLQAIGPTGNALSFNAPAWSISVEFYTYLIFGLAVFFARQLATYLFMSISLVSMVMIASGSTYGFDSWLRCLAGFFLGCLTARVLRDAKSIAPSFLPPICCILIALFLQFKRANDLDYVVYFLTVSLIVSLLLSPDGRLKALLRHGMFLRLGRISYSVYMSQSLVIWGVGSVFKRILGRSELQDVAGRWTLSLNPFETLAATAAIILIVVLTGQITYSVVEKPMREWSRRLAAV